MREKLIELLKRTEYQFTMSHSLTVENVADDLIQQGVTIQKHGRWIHVPSSDMMMGKAYKCSECSKMRYGSYMPNYCQCCGAKMDGERDRND